MVIAEGEVPLVFHADDWFTITGIGRCAVVTEHGLADPHELSQQVVVIDGERYMVRGVETYAILGPQKKFPISLLVVPL